jgi:hypothetical protein
LDVRSSTKGEFQTKPLQRRIDLTITYVQLQGFGLRTALLWASNECPEDGQNHAESTSTTFD